MSVLCKKFGAVCKSMKVHCEQFTPVCKPVSGNYENRNSHYEKAKVHYERSKSLCKSANPQFQLVLRTTEVVRFFPTIPGPEMNNYDSCHTQFS